MMMGTCEEIRMSLGVHALGALEPEEEVLVEAHLAECEACRAEYRELGALPAFLATVSEADVAQAASPPQAVLGRLLSARARRHRRARLMLVAAASAVVLAGGGAVATAMLGDAGQNAESAAAAPEAQSDGQARRDAAQSREGADPPTLRSPAPSQDDSAPEVLTAPADRVLTADRGRVKARLTLSAAANGSTVQIALSGVPGGTRCRLIAIGLDGSADTAASWRVPAGGYEGAAAQFMGNTGFAPGRIDRFEVVTSGERVLLSIPVKR